LKGKVYFVGAGPGDPELITLKGRGLLERAGLVVYAGSLVNPRILDGLDAELKDSAAMNLDEIIHAMSEAVERGLLVVRLHTGDPHIYGAIQEQMERLDGLGIPYDVVPGVSSVFGAAAGLKRELTLPEVTQTVIITRRAGRTPVPERESLPELARHQSTMMILLSVSQIEEVVADLLRGGYPLDTPAHVVEKATWPEEKVIRGTLGDIADKTQVAGVTKTAIIAVGQALSAGSGPAASRLYDPGFTHEYRRGS